jgi:hypothetical protein
MNKQSLDNVLRAMSGAQPHPQDLHALKQRVMLATSKAETQPKVQANQWSFWRSFWFGGAVLAGMAALIVANTLPAHNQYQRSIAHLAEAQRTFELLEDKPITVQSLQDLRSATETTRLAFNDLSLNGSLLAYSQEQCLSAYVLFDGYLDYIADDLEAAMSQESNPEIQAAQADFQAYLAAVKAEASERINLYPQMR